MSAQQPPEPFTKPRLGALYVDCTGLGPFDATVKYCLLFRAMPEQVIWWKPGQWLAGPVPEAALEPADGPEPPEDEQPAALLVGWAAVELAPEPAEVTAGLDAASLEGIAAFESITAAAFVGQPPLF